MDRIKYGPAFGPKHVTHLMGQRTRVLKILWAYSWAGPLTSVKSRGPLAGPAHYDLQESCGPLPGLAHYGTQKSCGPLPRPAIMARKILWPVSWANPLWSTKSHGPLAGSAHYGP